MQIQKAQFFRPDDFSATGLRGRVEFLSAKSEAFKDNTLRGVFAAKVRDFILAHDLKMNEFLNAFVLMFWGLWVLYPNTDAFNTPTYELLKIFREGTWGSVFFTIGVAQLSFVIFNATKSLRKCLLSISFTAWFVLSILFLLASPHTPAFLPEVMTVLTLYKYLRLSLMEE